MKEPLWKAVEIPNRDKDGKYHLWWVPEHAAAVIATLEHENPGYTFHQFVTSPGNGKYREYALMKKAPVV